MTISIIVPALDEAGEIEPTLRSARDPLVREIILVDGGSRDETVTKARPLVDVVLSSPAGRATQMNRGAACAGGDIFLFLHADTLLPSGFGQAVRDAVAAGAVAGRFDVELRGTHRFLPVVAAMINLRSRLTRIYTGDQAIFVERSTFARVGGFPEIPLMEDVELSSRLRREGRIAALGLRVGTSARRWEEHGVARTIGLMWWLRFAYACGASPERLAASYRRRRR